MSVVNAGHMSPMIRKVDGSVEEFDEDSVGVPIGVMEGFPFETRERAIAAGETVILYTDGVSEAMNPASELYGMERLRDLVQSQSPETETLGKKIREDVRDHAQGTSHRMMTSRSWFLVAIRIDPYSSPMFFCAVIQD